MNRWGQIPRAFAACMVIVLLTLTACDAVEPEAPSVLVVEAFIDAEQPLPTIKLRRTLGLYVPYDDASSTVRDAIMQITLPDALVPYRHSDAEPGVYLPGFQRTTSAGSPFSITVEWQGQVISAAGMIPPRMHIATVETNVPERPVEAILLDSLQLDSLQTGARSGYVYPVEVTVWWEVDADELAADSTFWIRAQIKPSTDAVPGVVDLFFPSERIMREDRALRTSGRRHWTGVYLVPVEREEDDLPEHSVKVSLLRSGQDYARFASSRDAPERREPVSNVHGGIGMVAGISVDSRTIKIRQASD